MNDNLKRIMGGLDRAAARREAESRARSNAQRRRRGLEPFTDAEWEARKVAPSAREVRGGGVAAEVARAKMERFEAARELDDRVLRTVNREARDVGSIALQLKITLGQALRLVHDLERRGLMGRLGRLWEPTAKGQSLLARAVLKSAPDNGATEEARDFEARLFVVLERQGSAWTGAGPLARALGENTERVRGRLISMSQRGIVERDSRDAGKRKRDFWRVAW